MTKQVFTNEMTAHVWAQQRQSSGRSNNGNLYFQDRTLYSYGSHFAVGFIAAPGVVFLNSSGYSISTAGHKSDAWQAVRHYSEQFSIPDLTSYVDTLRAIVRFRNRELKPSAADLKAIRATVDSAVESLAHSSPDAAAWMLQQVGLPADRVAVIARKVDRAKARKLAADTREAVATWRADGRKFAEMSPSEFASALNAIRYQENGYAAQSELERFADKLARAHKQAIADKFNRRKVALWARLQRVRAARKEAAGLSSYRNDTPLAKTVRAIAIVREASRRFALGDVPGPHAFDQVARHIGVILEGRVSPATRAKLDSYMALVIAGRDAVTRHLEAERFAKEAAERADWLSGVTGYSRSRLSDEMGGALIRARNVERDADGAIIGGELETSHGATVPLCHAIKAFRFLKLCHDTGRQWQANGRTIHVGHFRIDRVEPSGDFVAGCHRINWPETERLARLLGVDGFAADESALVPSQAAA